MSRGILCGAVTAVANGLEAWKVLANLSNNVDIVLTEVVMPSLSGIGLLDKIMSHITLKTIPVISENFFCAFISFSLEKLYPFILNIYTFKCIKSFSCSDVIS